MNKGIHGLMGETVASLTTDEELRERFPTRRDTFQAGYCAGRADTSLEMLKTLRSLCAILERNIEISLALFDGDTPPKPH